MYVSDCWIQIRGRRFINWWLTYVVCVVIAGCGEPNPLKGAKLFPVQGKVVLGDGKPLTSGQIVFVGEKTMVTSRADIGSDGGFNFAKEGSGGLPEGEYKVRLEVGAAEKAKGSGTRVKSQLPYASKYGDEDETDLKATVTSDESKNNFEFKLDIKNATTATAGKGGK